jgi:hypothetical protein
MVSPEFPHVGKFVAAILGGGLGGNYAMLIHLFSS